MKNREWIILLIILIAGVVLVKTRPSFKEYLSQEAVSVQAEPEYNVVKIFEHDGCTGYKFYTQGYGYSKSNSHFFVKCGNEVLTTSMKRCGKSSCPEEISTQSSDK